MNFLYLSLLNISNKYVFLSMLQKKICKIPQKRNRLIHCQPFLPQLFFLNPSLVLYCIDAGGDI